MPGFFEFFAGGGMARAGLGSAWNCMFANDFDFKKSRVYEMNWGRGVLRTADVGSLTIQNLPGAPDLVWASFPCQDLSLAGGGAGLKGERSGTFWPFWNLISAMVGAGRAPRLVVLENVCGTLTSHDGADFSTICSALQEQRYSSGAVVIDAALFVPQSRPRLFVVGVMHGLDLPSCTLSRPSSAWHTRSLRTAYDRLAPEVQSRWIWWDLPEPSPRVSQFADLIEEEPESVRWHSRAETQRLLGMMNKLNLTKVEAAKSAGKRMVGAVYKRTRHDENGDKVQRAEVRFDDVAGCLRTPAGGSSRQLIIVVDGPTVRSRLISSREAARLMGLPDDYQLPENYNEAYHLVGDGVVVPVVRHLAKCILEPILSANPSPGHTREAA